MTELHHGTSSQVSRQLRELNTETHAVTKALNQAQASLTHAMKLVQLTYHEKRKAIMNGHMNGNGHEDPL